MSVYEKTILCLANSRKPPSGRCIAGREITDRGFGSWLRPVSDRLTREVSARERRYRNGQDPQVLDVIAIPLKNPEPLGHQIENHILDPFQRWVKKGSLTWNELSAAIDEPTGTLWENGSSTYNGFNDRVPESAIDLCRNSLYLIVPEDLILFVGDEGMPPNPPRRKVRAQFRFHGEHYRLVVTDPWMESNCLARPNGEYEIPEVVLCVSLGEVYQGFAYKLAASIITPF